MASSKVVPQTTNLSYWHTWDNQSFHIRQYQLIFQSIFYVSELPQTWMYRHGKLPIRVLAPHRGYFCHTHITRCITKKREKGEVMTTKKIARPCRMPVISHLSRILRQTSILWRRKSRGLWLFQSFRYFQYSDKWNEVNLARELCDQADISSPLINGMSKTWKRNTLINNNTPKHTKKKYTFLWTFEILQALL